MLGLWSPGIMLACCWMSQRTVKVSARLSQSQLLLGLRRRPCLSWSPEWNISRAVTQTGFCSSCRNFSTLTNNYIFIHYLQLRELWLMSALKHLWLPALPDNWIIAAVLFSFKFSLCISDTKVSLIFLHNNYKLIIISSTVCCVSFRFMSAVNILDLRFVLSAFTLLA